MSSRPGIVGQGFGDGRLVIDCPTCDVSITKELLGVAKFVADAKTLIIRGVPMPGTLLDPRSGIPELVPTGMGGQIHGFTFPNRMIKRALAAKLVDLIKPGMDVTPDMMTIRRMIEAVLANQWTIREIEGVGNSAFRYRVQPVAKICIRLMMARYWENFSIFALDLTGAVMRQGVFVDKMCKIDWLHSPSAPDTMTRVLKKYTRFMAIIAGSPSRIAVPTLDVDLAWHTHQLCPSAYFRYVTKMTQKFIDHDDKMDEGKLGNCFEWTSRVYQERYGEVYSECTCWYCESAFSSPRPPSRRRQSG